MSQPILMLRYKRLKFDDVGIRKRWKRKPILLWDEVADVVTTVTDGEFGWYYETTLQSTSRRRLSLKCEKQLSSFRIVHVYSGVLDFILSHVPEDVACDKTRFVAKWGADTSVTKETEQAVRQDPYRNETALKSLANRCWVKLEYRKARRLFQRILEMNPHDTETLEALALIDIETGKSIDAVIAQYEHLLSLVPNSERCLRMLAVLLLELDDARGEEYARRLFQTKPDDVPTSETLSMYYLRKGAFPEARAVIEQLKDATDNAKVREFAEEELDYIDRYETDGRFRKKEKTRRSLRKLWWFIGAIVVPLLGLLYWLYGIVREILNDRAVP